MDRKALIGLLSGVAMVVATMIGVALVNTHPAEGADALSPAPHECSPGSKPAEAGYAAGSPGTVCARAY